MRQYFFLISKLSRIWHFQISKFSQTKIYLTNWTKRLPEQRALHSQEEQPPAFQFYDLDGCCWSPQWQLLRSQAQLAANPPKTSRDLTSLEKFCVIYRIYCYSVQHPQLCNHHLLLTWILLWRGLLLFKVYNKKSSTHSMTTELSVF